MRTAAWILCALLLCPARALLAAPAWEQPPFTADAALLAAEAKALPVPERTDWELLSDELTVSFDAQGRRTSTTRLVLRVLTPQGARSQASVERVWSPWHQERPELKARVISPEGKEAWLAQETLAEGPAGDGEDEERYVDLRRVRGPLPAVTPGALLEVQTVLREHQPYFAAGFTGRYYLGAGVPVHHTRVRIEAPRSVPLKVLVRGRSEPFVRSQQNGIQAFTLDVGPLAPLAADEPHQPLDATPWPFVAYGSGESWSRIAQAYADVVERQIKQAPPEKPERPAPGESRQQTAARHLARIQKELRYEAVELGEGAIVPRAPAEVLTRGYGDCKDLATLLVAWLRAQGIAANVALVRSGGDDAVDLPGLGDFTHAIVQLPGSPTLWIDPTDPDTPVGQLPVEDAGRLALVAARGTTALVRLPAVRSQDHRSTVTRDIQLSESGHARIVETRQSAGWFASSLRGWLRARSSEQQKEGYTDYATTHYEAERLDTVVLPASDDMREPLTVKLEVGEARVGWTGREEARARLKPFGMLFSLLPEQLVDAPPEDDRPRPPHPPRTQPLRLELPFQVEVRYRIVPPAGFSGRPLPEDETQQWGPARFERHFEREASGVVTARYRFDTGDGLFSAADVETVRAGIALFGQEDQLAIAFESVAEAHLAAGRVKEAIAQHLQLARLHPTEALHQRELAQTLLRTGLGEAARQAAQRAVELEPKNDEAFEMLGWVREHDLLGRHLGAGFDHAGSVAAYRTARSLAPGRPELRAALARLLALDAEGRPLRTGKALDEAIAEYESIGRELKEHGFDDALLELLARTERIAELEKAARAAPESEVRNALLLAAAAVRAGPPAAELEAAKLKASVEVRRQALRNAVQKLLAWRRYEACARLLTTLTHGSAEAAKIQPFLDLLARMRRHEEQPLAVSDPATPMKKLVAIFADEQPDLETLRNVVVPTDEPQPLDEDVRRVLLGSSQIDEDTLPRGALIDLLLSLLRVQPLDGDDRVGRRLRVEAAFDEHHMSFVHYVVRGDDGAWRLAALDEQPASLGVEALRRLDRGETDAALQWLAWAQQAVTRAPARFRLFQTVWPAQGARSLDDARLAATALVVTARATPAAVSTLAAARKTRDAGPLATLLDEALATSYAQLGRWDEALAVARSLTQQEPDAEQPVLVAARALTELGRGAEALQLVQEARSQHPQSSALAELAAALAARTGDLDQAERIGRSLVVQGSAGASTYNNLAWNALVRAGASEQALADAQQALRLSKRRSRAALHTLALLQAEREQPADALRTLLESLELDGARSPEPSDWLVVGRIAESYGLREVAAGAYARVQPDARPAANDASVLAARHLRRLQSAPVAPAR